MTTCVTPNTQFTNTPQNCYNGYPVGAFNPTGVNQPYGIPTTPGNFTQGFNNPQTQPFVGQPMNTAMPFVNATVPTYFPGCFSTPQFSYGYGAYTIQNTIPAFNPFINGITPWNINPFWTPTPWNTLPCQQTSIGHTPTWFNGFVPSVWNINPFFGQSFGQPFFGQNNNFPNFTNPGLFAPNFNLFNTPGTINTPWNLSTQPVFNTCWNTPAFSPNFNTPWNTTNINPFVNTFPTANVGPFIHGTPSITPNVLGTPWTGILNTLGTLCQPTSWSTPLANSAWTSTFGAVPPIFNTLPPIWNSFPPVFNGFNVTPWNTPNFNTFGTGTPLVGPGTTPFTPSFGGTFNPNFCSTPVNGYAPAGYPQGAPINPNFVPGNRPVSENGDYAARGTI